MDDEIRQFVITALKEMNYDVSQVTGDTRLGPAGLDLESLAVADLTARAEDRFGVKFSDDDTGRLARLTLDEFAAEVAGRTPVAGKNAPSGRPAAPGRDEVIDMLAALGDRTPAEVAERIGSLELTWLITKVEQEYNVTLELGDDALAQMTTITGAVAALRDELSGAANG